MGRGETAVLEFIQEHFFTADIEITDFPLFPAGKLIMDKNKDTMVVYWDGWTELVQVAFPDAPPPS